jgi:hypothetical protein
MIQINIALLMKITVFWDTKMCWLVIFFNYPENEDRSLLHQNVSNK